MKIGILGIRGIPNKHGGFEQFTEYVAPSLTERGHAVFVYNSSLHPYKESFWKGVHLLKKYDPENKIGTAGQFIYDLNCILDARRRKFDIILQLGYTSSSLWHFLLPKKSVIVTNMDGLEWKRSKYSKPVQRFLRKAEKWAVMHSHKLIADSKGIQQYLKDKYGKDATFIAYGASLFTEANEDVIRATYGLQRETYNLLIARMEPENNIETILTGHRQSLKSKKLLLIGNYENKFGSYLKAKYGNEHTVFLGPVYNMAVLNNLRYFSHFYFHGHSVGGTNPSLLEAMASQALIVAHDNVFNKSVLNECAFYFSSSDDVTEILDSNISKQQYAVFLENNNLKIVHQYSWSHIVQLLENCLTEALHENK